ncbi:MAG: pre-peptidase C-terminal domain-containing protein [Pirellulales bacterium]|nr:pre-peptidase C-terminal domain-containing protein [Pirellulales bacterium]
MQEYNRDATIDRYTLSLQATLLDALKDAYEDDNLSATAHVIATNGVPEVHNIHHPGDVDWFKFHLAAASRVTLETDGPDGNTWMALYAAGALETPIASDSYSGNGDFSRIVQYHLDAGDYYVRVQENWQDATIARYTMSVTATPLTALRDAREVDDSPSASSPLVATDGTPQPRTLHEPSDVDWARFTLAAASNVVIATDGSSGDTQMWLFGPGNWTTQIAYDNHSGKDAFARISASLGAGTYYVKISEYGQNEPVDDYAVSVFAVPQANPRDAYEADDSAAQAVLIPADGSRRAHNFHNGADVDWVKFDVLAPSKVVVETDGANGDTQLRLFASGSYDWSDPLAYDDDGGYGDFSRIVAYLAPGRYYAAASECGQNNPIDHFTLAVTATAVDALKDASENPGDDTAAGATMLVPESTIQARTLHEPTDVDWFRFYLGDTSLVTLTTISEIDEYSASTQVSLFGPDNSTTLMTSRYSSGVNLDIQRVLAAGTYFVRVEERGNNAGIAQYAIGLSAAPLGDLVPEDGWLSSSLSVGLGETITVHWTARNNGPGTTDPYQQGYEYWYDEVYLSLDDQLDSSDRYLGYRRSDSDPLDAQDQYVASRSVTIPNDTDWAGRDAYILVVIDSDADLDETDETNNILAIHIQTENYIELLAPYVGRYLDVSTPTEFRWLACDTQPGAVVSLAIDEDADPSNGSYQWILLNEPVSDQNVVETATVTISDVTPRTEPYYIWAAVTDSQGTTYSEPVAVLVAERAYGSGRVTSDPVGGNRYSVAGIEAAEVAGQYYIRVRTSYPPDKGRGGDLHIVVGDTVFGLCVHSHTIADGTRVIAGDLYQEAEFLMGTCVSSVPTFIDSYTTHIPGKSSVQVIETPDENWGYEIIATIDTDVLTSSAVASTTSSEESAEFCAGWSMYCGNDTDRVCVPEDKPDLAVRAFSYDSENNTAELSYSISGEEIASTSTVAVFWATGSTADDIIDSAIFQSPTESIPGEYGPITVPATSLQSRPGEATHLIAIIDPDGSVDEQDEDNNLRSVSIALEDPAPEILAREVAYRNWIDDSTNPQSIGYGDYVVDEVISGAGFYTIGLVRSETSSPSRRDPILVFRGTNVSNWEDRLASIFTDLNPEGIGYDKFVSYKSEVVSWVEQYVGETVDLIGHSLGGALAQWFAVDLTSALGIQIGHVYTYNSPGIGEDEAKSFVSSLCEGVVHSVVNGDVVSLAGEAFIQGTVNLYSYDDWNPLAKHRRPVEVKECNGLKRPTAAENFTVENISVEELSGDWFFYDDLEYVSCLAGAQATLIAGDIVDGLGEWYNDNVKYLPAKLFFRKTTEDARRELGAAIYEFLEVDPKTTNLVIDSIYLHSGWELRNVEIDWHNIATGSLEIKAGLKFPTVGVGLDLKPLIIGVQVGVAGGELTTLGAYAEGIQEPLPYGIFLQEISAAVEHFAESDPNPLTVCGGIGFSYGPEFEVTFPNNFVVENLRGERYEFSLASLNGEVSADRDKFEMSGELSVLDESIIHGTGELSYDWSKGLLHGSATLDVLYGLMGGFAANIVARAIGGVYTFSAQGSATISIPDEIPTIGGSILGSGIGGIFCNNDGNFGNDHIYVKVETSFFHKVFVVGFDLYLDGEYDVKFGFGPWSPSTEAACGISAMEAASDANGSSTTMLFVEWENDVPNARAALILPDGTRITEDDISTRSDIELVEILCTSRRRVFAVQSDPETVDLWTVELSGVTGTVTRSLYAENAAPTFSFDAVSGGGTAPLSIDYTLHDSDSMPSVRFFLDTDKTGADGVPISDWLGVSDVPYLTIPKDIASDTYYLYAEITDEYHVSSIQYNATAIAVVTEPCLVINETAAVFATRATDTTETEVCVFTIENQGTAALEIADITQYTNDLSAFQVAVVGHDGTSLHGDGLSIPSGGQSQIVVTFVGSRAGQKQMSIEFSTNDPAIAALSLDVTGSVVEPQVWTTINVENDDPVTIAISDLANVDHGLSGHTISLVTCRSLFTTHGTLLQTEDQLVFSPDETFGREATFTYVLMDNTGASCECGIRVINSNAASSVDISAVIVAERTATGTDGETDTLPDSVDWLDEWASYWVEIWISTPESDTLSVASAVVDLFYDTSCFSPKRIEYGPAFTENQTATIDDAVGVIHGLGAATAATGVSDDRYVLLARVEFDSLLPGDAAGVLVVPEQYVSAAPCGVELAGGQVALAGDVAADVELGPAPTTELWPVMYDVDNNGEVGLGDLSFFAAAYRHTVGEAGSSHTYACDFDLNGEVGLGDLSYFAAAYRHKHTDSEPMIYSDSDPLFPDDWRFVSAPSAAVAAMEQSGAAFLAGETENDTRGTALERSLCDAVLAESHDWVARQIVFQADRVTWPCAFARHSVSKRTTRLPAPDSPAIFLPSGSSCPSGKRV